MRRTALSLTRYGRLQGRRNQPQHRLRARRFRRPTETGGRKLRPRLHGRPRRRGGLRPKAPLRRGVLDPSAGRRADGQRVPPFLHDLVVPRTTGSSWHTEILNEAPPPQTRGCRPRTSPMRVKSPSESEPDGLPSVLAMPNASFQFQQVQRVGKRLAIGNCSWIALSDRGSWILAPVFQRGI